MDPKSSPHSGSQKERFCSYLLHWSKVGRLRNGLILGAVWRAVLYKIRTKSGNGGYPKIGAEKRHPPLRKQVPMTMARGSLTAAPRVRAFLNKKQLSEQETRTAAHFWIHFRALFLEWAIFWFHVWRNVHVLMKSETKKTSHCKCFSLTVPFQRLVIWHALGQGPANSTPL